MDYSKLSDAEISYKVAIKIGINASLILSISSYGIGGGTSKWVRDNTKDASFDPCNNPADAWPIIEKHGITLAFDGSDWWATSDACWVDGCEWQIEGEINRKPLRAAMIVFLMMQESE